MDYYKIINSDGVEEIIYISYNPNNILITENDILKILNSNNVNVKKIILIYLLELLHINLIVRKKIMIKNIRCKKYI